jgi:hypothetical protein
MPWSMINSTTFYTLFDEVRQMLFEREITHRTGGEFLRTLKMLMAKIQVMYKKLYIRPLTSPPRHVIGALWTVS